MNDLEMKQAERMQEETREKTKEALRHSLKQMVNSVALPIHLSLANGLDSLEGLVDGNTFGEAIESWVWNCVDEVAREELKNLSGSLISAIEQLTENTDIEIPPHVKEAIKDIKANTKE
jgi:hypothetical protein